MSCIIMNQRFLIGKGSQDQMIKVRKDDEIMVKCIYRNKDHSWANIKPETFIEMTKTESNNQLQEIIHQFPVKVYFDIDGTKPEECNLDIIKPIINKHFNNPKMAIAGYESETKNSYHIVLPDLLIKDYNDLLNMKKLVNKIKEEENKYFDASVYSRNRAMKCVNQSKPNKPVSKIIEDNTYENHFITCAIKEDAKPFYFDIDYDTTKINVSKLPKATKELKEAVQNKFKTFKPIDHDNALKLLNLMPIDADLHHDYCWKFCNFAFHNGLSFNEFWAWNKQKKDSAERRNRFTSYWNNMKDDVKLCKSWARKVLSVYYPNIHVLEDVRTKSFMDSFNLLSVDIPVKVMPNYETADIRNNHFTTDQKVAIFNIGMGGGKTGATVKYLKESKKSFVWLSVRQALAMNTNQRFITDKLDVYNYLDDGNTEKKNENINKAKSLLISCESLHYLKNTKKFDVLVIDEIESLLNCWDSITHGKNLEDNFYNFKALFEHCKKVVLLDAFTTSKTIDFLKSIGINDIITYSCQYKKQPRRLIENENFDDILNKIVKDVNEKKKIFVFYPFLNDGDDGRMGIKSLECAILKKADVKPNIITYMSVASDKVKKTLYDVKNTWADADVILTTSSITVGVNYEGSDFDKVYLLTSGMCNLARDLIQVSLRIRCPRKSDIEMFFFDKNTNFVYKYNDLYKNKTDLIYNTLIDGLVVEKLADFTASFFKYADLSGFIRSGIKATKQSKVQTSFDVAEKADKKPVKVIMAYEDIDVIDEITCRKIELEKIWVSDATMEEKFQVKKFYFDRRFKKLSKEEREFIWNNRLDQQFKNLYDPLIKMIETDNKCGIVDVDFKNLVVSDTTRNYIKTTYTDFKVKNEKTQILKLINHNISGFKSPSGSNDVVVDEEVRHLYDIGIKYKIEENWFVDE